MGDEQEDLTQEDTQDQHESFPDPVLDGEGEDDSSPDSEPVEAEGDLSLEDSIPPEESRQRPLPSVGGEPLPVPDYQPPPADEPYTPPRQETAPAPPAPPPPQPSAVTFYSRDQLQQATEQGIITQSQMDDQLLLQMQENAVRESVARVKAENVKARVDGDLAEYRRFVPGWDQTGSPANKRATPAFERLLGLGFPDNDSTRIVALEQTFGPINRIKEARNTQKRTASSRDTAREVGGRGKPPVGKSSKDPLDSISMEEKRYYKELIASRVYSGWDAVRKELRWAETQEINPKIRAKAGSKR